DVVGKDVVANIASRGGRAHHGERRREKTGGRGSRRQAIEVDRVVIHLVARAGLDANAEYAKRGRERRSASHVVVNVADEVVLDDVIVSAGRCDSKRSERAGVVVYYAFDIVSFDCHTIGGAAYSDPKDCCRPTRGNIKDGILNHVVVRGGGRAADKDSCRR